MDELISAGICTSMADVRRLRQNMERSRKCKEKIRKMLEERKGSVVKVADAPASKAGSPEE